MRRARGVPERTLADPDYVKAGVLFEGFDQFDAGFFGYSPREAEHLDPQQRIFLECAWEALEHAGWQAGRGGASVGVYAGDGPNLYLMRHLLPAFGVDAGTGIADMLGLMSGNSAGSLCTRVAYKLDLRGPAVSVQTECSTSLVAVHMACQALLSHDCDMALAGGVWLNLLQEGGYRFQNGAILSPDGHCRAFDAKAAGTVIGSGAGIVVLKRLAEALRDGDTIHAVIKGTAANNDGSDKIGFTAVTTQDIWVDHPEKILGTTAEWVAKNPNTARAMTAAILDAGRWIDASLANRRKTAETVAAKSYVNTDMDVILERMLGRYSHGLGKSWDDKNAMKFFNDGAVNYPYLSDGMWFLTQHKRWGLIKTDPDYLAVAKAINRTDIYKQAAAATQTPVPKDPMRSSKLIDGTVWDGRNPAKYADGFKIKA